MTKLELYKKFEKDKFKYYLSKYPEVKHIFGKRNQALSFLECDGSYRAYNKLFRQYNKYCKILNEVQDNLTYGIAKLINDISEGANLEEIMYIYSYLVYNGYLSINNTFEFDVPDKELPGNIQLSIYTGKGVCRNIGRLLVDVLNNFNVFSFGIITDRESHESAEYALALDYYNYVKKDSEEFDKKYESMISKRDRMVGNHYEVVAFLNNWQVLDPSSIISYNLSKKENEYPALNYLKPWSLYAYGEHDIKDTAKIYRLLNNRYLHIKDEDINHITQEKCLKLCKEKQHLIDEFSKTYSNHIKILGLGVLDSKRI